MLDPKALQEKQDQIQQAIKQKSRKSFSILTGAVGSERLTLVLIGCHPTLYGEWLERLSELRAKYPHLSLHLARGVCNIQFILRGRLHNPRWVSTHLLKFKDAMDSNSSAVGIYTVDLTPVRLRFDETPGFGPIKIERPQKKGAAGKLIARGGRWLDAPSNGSPFY